MIRKFFLADDDPDDTELFTEALFDIDHEFEINTAHNGRDLISKLLQKQDAPHLIFLDINMPEMNGWECLEKLKQEDGLRNIPVIMFSTSSATIYGKRAVMAGALGFYEKPTSFMHLKEFLQQIAGSTPDELRQTLKALQATNKHIVYIE